MKLMNLGSYRSARFVTYLHAVDERGHILSPPFSGDGDQITDEMEADMWLEDNPGHHIIALTYELNLTDVTVLAPTGEYNPYEEEA